MSVIGHSIQTNIANVHIALRQQQAGQIAQSDEEARRRSSVQRQEEQAREEVHQVQESFERRARRIAEENRKRRRNRRSRPGPGDQDSTREKQAPAAAEGSQAPIEAHPAAQSTTESPNSSAGAHLDLLA